MKLVWTAESGQIPDTMTPEGGGKKEDVRGKRDDGRWKMEEGRGKKEDGRGKM